MPSAEEDVIYCCDAYYDSAVIGALLNALHFESVQNHERARIERVKAEWWQLRKDRKL